MHAVLDSIPGGEGGSENSPRPGDLIADRYQIERFIGRGGMAEVFAGLNVRTGKRVALKWIRPALATTTEALARFRREAVAAGRIHHPNVVTVFDVVEHKSATWLVMELLEGETLSEILSRVDRMDPESAIALLIPAMRGVAAAHAHGVVHRDIKPDNIFICRAEDGHRREAKVLDFGVSKLADESGDQVNITMTGSLVGTPTYMPPEQVRGTKTVDPRSDIYALGVVLYQMLAGRTPFQGKVYSALMIEIATTEPPMLRSLRPDLPVELEKIVHRAIARDIEQRYPDVTSLVHALEELVSDEVAHTPTRTPTRLPPMHSGAIRVPGAAAGSGPVAVRGAAPDAPTEVATPVPAEISSDTLQLERQRLRRTKIAVITVAALVVVAIGIKVLSSPRLRSGSRAAAPVTAPPVPQALPPVAPPAHPAIGAAPAVEPPAAAAAAVEPAPAAAAAVAPAAKDFAGPAAEKPHGARKGGALSSARKEKSGDPSAQTSSGPRVVPPATTGSRAGRLSIDDF
jgi:serine/threonine-protein kinase